MKNLYNFYDGKKNVSTLLSEFINTKINAYQEPVREGTPKGEAIGFSRKKYVANLFMMTNLTQKEIAKKSGVSFGSLRNCNMQEPFKKMLEKNCLEFAAIVFHRICLKTSRDIEILDNYIEGLTDDEPADHIDMRLWSEVKDINNYGRKLKQTIESTINQIIRKLSGSTLNAYEQIFGRFFRLLRNENYQPSKDEIKLERALSKLRAETALKILEREKLTKKQRRQISEIIKLLLGDSMLFHDALLRNK